MKGFTFLALLLLSTISPHADAWLSTPRHHRRSSSSLTTAALHSSSALLLQSSLAPRRQSVLYSSSTAAESSSSTSSSISLPELGDNGVYHIQNKEEHQALLEANPDKLIILKVFAPWCRACKGLEPKFLQLVHSPKYQDLPILWADLSIQHNKAFVQSIGVLALPTIQFYVGASLNDNFPCGPSKISILKRKLAQLVNDHVDAETYKLKPEHLRPAIQNDTAIEAPAEEAVMTQTERQQLRNTIPYFQEMSLADLDTVLDHAKILTFEAGSILMREGRPGRTFYVLKSGEVEICQNTMAEDPLTQSSYLGTVMNRLQAGDYFGERALITGEPRAASIRATEPVTCWALDKDDFPHSSVLSGRTKGVTDVLDAVNDKYGVSFGDLYAQEVSKQIQESSTANQVRGSVNTPELLRGVDTDEEDLEEFVQIDYVAKPTPRKQPTPGLQVEDDDAIFSLLTRFQMIRNVNRCFQYIVDKRARWGDAGIRKRRSMLVKRLTKAQRDEFSETFKLIDVNGDGTISLLELKRVMESIGETKSDDELTEIMDKGHDTGAINGEAALTFQDFMGIMAEAEFYHLFRDIFASLDKDDTGFVKASEIDRALCGVRDLISDDHKSIIDVDDPEMQIDYDAFSRMMLGTALI